MAGQTPKKSPIATETEKPVITAQTGTCARKLGKMAPTTSVTQMEKILTELAHDRDRVEQVRRQGMAYVRECLTWEAKAQATTRVLHWVVRRGPKPDLPPPKMLLLRTRASQA